MLRYNPNCKKGKHHRWNVRRVGQGVGSGRSGTITKLTCLYCGTSFTTTYDKERACPQEATDLSPQE